MKKIITIIIVSILSTGLWAQDLDKIMLKDAGSGAQFDLNSLKSGKGAVLLFWGNRCAYNDYYVDRIKRLANDFKAEGIRFVLVNSNPNKVVVEESEQNMKLYLQDKKLTFPYLVDTDQALKKSLNASRSPEAFLLVNRAGKFEVFYAGAIDDSPQSEGDVSHPYLKEAILSLLRNEKPAANRTRPSGCLIR